MKFDGGNQKQSDCEEDEDMISHTIESFEALVPTSNDSTEKKLEWLRSQIIGGPTEFDTPFGRRRLTYADHTATGRSLRYIEHYITTYLLPFYGNSHTSDSYVGYHTTKMMHESRKYVKKCLGGGKEDAIIFCGSGATAAIKRLQEVMGVAIPSILRERVLKCLSEEERWVVLVGPYEHHSNLLSWRQSLAEVVEIGLDHRGSIDMDALTEKLHYYKSRNRPILGSFSACSNVTGIITNTRAVARLLHQFGGFACFDFAASGPYTKMNMRSGEMEGYDAIFVSTHKFVGGPGAPGILLMANTLYRLASSPPSTCGGGIVDYVNAFQEEDTIYVENIEEREDAGTPAIIGKVRAALAFWVKEYIGCKAIKRAEESYITRALQRLAPNPRICVLGNTTTESTKRQAILSFLVYEEETRRKPLHGPFVAKLLNDLFGIQARGGCACAGPYGHLLLNIDQPNSLAFRSVIQKGYAGMKPGWTRVSFPYYMSEEEFDFILAAIEFIAVYGHRFLYCYHFNWRTGAWNFKKNILKDQHHPNISKGSSLANLHETRHQKSNENVLGKYATYFETANLVASLLPKIPPPRNVPKDIDIDLVPFRV